MEKKCKSQREGLGTRYLEIGYKHYDLENGCDKNKERVFSYLT